MQEPAEAGDAWRAWLLARLGMTEVEAAADENTFIEHALRVLDRPNKSGYRDVFPVGDKWQAKVREGIVLIERGCSKHRGRHGWPSMRPSDIAKSASSRLSSRWRPLSCHSRCHWHSSPGRASRR